MLYHSDAEIYARVRDYLNGSEHPDLKVYRESFRNLTEFDRSGHKWLWRMRHLCELGKFRDCRILEVGCGFGWDAVSISMIGNNQVVASDILPSMIDGLTECLDSANRQNPKINVAPLIGDICDLELAPDSFDGIYSSEAVEHVHSLELMFDKCKLLLKPGGKLIVVNDSNRFNAKFRDATFEMWKERDTSWEHAEFLKTVRPIEHRNAKPYAIMREEIVRKTDPQLDTNACAVIVAATAGLTEPDIAAVTRKYRQGAKLPTPPKFSWCRNPETGEYAERLLDPFELAEMLKTRGLKTRVLHAFRRFPIRLLNNIQFRPLNVMLFNLRPPFILVAEKPSN